VIEKAYLARGVLDLGLVARDYPVAFVDAAVLNATVAVFDTELDFQDKVLQ